MSERCIRRMGPPLALPFLAWRQLSFEKRSLRPWLYVGVTLLAVAAAHPGYRYVYGHLQNGPAAYHHADGRFLLMFALPLVRAEAFPGGGVGSRILPEVKVPLGLPRESRYPLQVRDSHMWSPDGIVAAVQRHSNDILSAEALARTIARNAIVRDPPGTVHLGLLTLRSHFAPTLRGAYDPTAFAALITAELGPQVPPRANELEAYSIGQASIGPSLTRS